MCSLYFPHNITLILCLIRVNKYTYERLNNCLLKMLMLPEMACRLHVICLQKIWTSVALNISDGNTFCYLFPRSYTDVVRMLIKVIIIHNIYLFCRTYSFNSNWNIQTTVTVLFKRNPRMYKSKTVQVVVNKTQHSAKRFCMLTKRNKSNNAIESLLTIQ